IAISGCSPENVEMNSGMVSRSSKIEQGDAGSLFGGDIKDEAFQDFCPKYYDALKAFAESCFSLNGTSESPSLQQLLTRDFSDNFTLLSRYVKGHDVVVGLRVLN